MGVQSEPFTASLCELAAKTGASVEGDGEVRVAHVATLEHAQPGDIAFLTNPRYRALLSSTRASAVIVSPDGAAMTSLPKLVSLNPYAVYARVAAILHPDRPPDAGVHETAQIDPTAHVAPSASIGAFVVVGARVRVGERSVLGAHVVLGDGVTIGDDAIIDANVTIYRRCMVGARTLIHSGAVLGADGFGLAHENGHWLKIPQIGRVVVGADVEIGANTTIDRGAIDDTIIEDGVKLDNQIQIGHNCIVGENTAIAGCVGIAGSTRIGRRCRIGGAAMISGHLEIADDTTISAATQVYDSIREPGVYTGALHALPHAEWKQVAARLRRLRELGDRVKMLERALETSQAIERAAKGRPR